MKPEVLFSVIAFCLASILQAQSKTTFFTKQGEPFYLIVDAQRINLEPQYRVDASNIGTGEHIVKIIFEDPNIQDVDSRISVRYPDEVSNYTVYQTKKAKTHKRVFLFFKKKLKEPIKAKYAITQIDWYSNYQKIEVEKDRRYRDSMATLREIQASQNNYQRQLLAQQQQRYQDSINLVRAAQRHQFVIDSLRNAPIQQAPVTPTTIIINNNNTTTVGNTTTTNTEPAFSGSVSTPATSDSHTSGSTSNPTNGGVVPTFNTVYQSLSRLPISQRYESAKRSCEIHHFTAEEIKKIGELLLFNNRLAFYKGAYKNCKNKSQTSSWIPTLVDAEQGNLKAFLNNGGQEPTVDSTQKPVSNTSTTPEKKPASGGSVSSPSIDVTKAPKKDTNPAFGGSTVSNTPVPSTKHPKIDTPKPTVNTPTSKLEIKQIPADMPVILERIQNAPFGNNGKLSEAKELVQKYTLSVDQVKDITELMGSESHKMSLLKHAYDNMTNVKGFDRLATLFKSKAFASQLTEYIKNNPK